VARISKLDKWQEDESITTAIRRLATSLVEGITNRNCVQTMLDAFCSTLNGGLFSRAYIPDDKNSPNFDVFRHIVSITLEQEGTLWDKPASTMRQVDNAEKDLRGRSLLSKTCGGIGLEPDTTKAGDQVVILFGGRGAFVRCPLENGQFEMVGA
jgi:hypothetical protein